MGGWMIFQEQDTGFPLTERDRLGLRGLLPPRVISFEQQYACFRLFRHPLGMYFSVKDREEMMSMIHNWPAHQLDMIVMTDGSRILGLGDLGVQGIGIPIGKLDMYVAAAGINPQRILPVMLDVGTNNQKLLEDPIYLGLGQPRLEGEEYLSIVDEFMEAAQGYCSEVAADLLVLRKHFLVWLVCQWQRSRIACRATIVVCFAYGQTGSGKTYTMLGDTEDLELKPSPHRGMTPRIFEFLFARIEAVILALFATEEEIRRDEKLKYNCKCSFLEIYNEQITDLLDPSSTYLLGMSVKLTLKE
ncbi:NAD-dependent malic enzyme 59 kDa isoform, mitochondrial [Fagus crenata]